MSSIKDRLILGIGLNVIERPRELQSAANNGEHSIVHELHVLRKQGLVACKVRKNLHSSGRNLTDIRLTPKGIERYRELSK